MKCPACNKEGAYIRFKTSDIICRICGAISPLEPPQEIIDKVKKAGYKEMDKKKS